MKLITLLFTLTISTSLFCQEIRTIDALQEKDSAFFEYEDYDANQKPIGGLVFLKGCSWYCGGAVKTIKASSELKSNNGINYSPNNAHDFNKNTAWIEGKEDYGIGEYIEYYFPFNEKTETKNNLSINQILIANGYKKSKNTWKNNSRVKQIKVYLNNTPYAMLNLLDVFEVQSFDIGDIKLPPNKETILRFEITQVYKGDKYKDTAISLLMFDGKGVH